MNVLALLQELGPPLSLHVNIRKCEVFSQSSLDISPADIKKSNNPNIEILGSPIGDADFCHHFISHKQSETQNLLPKLEDVGLVDPQATITLLRMCGGFCQLAHLSCTTPPSLSGAALHLYNQDVHRCFSSCTAVDTSDAAWRQAILGLSKGGLGLRSLYQHAPAAYPFAKLDLVQRQTFTSVLQLEILILLFHSLLSASLVSQPLFWTYKNNISVIAVV